MIAACTPQQLRMLYGVARKAGMDSDDLHARAWEAHHVESLRDLTSGQCARLIDGITGKKTADRPIDRATQGQIGIILGLRAKMGWDDTRLRGWIRSRYGVEHIDWMTAEDARQCIEALKAMLAGGRSERKNQLGGRENG